MTRDEAIRDLTIALMYLTRFNDREGAPFHELSWKGYDFDTIEKLDEDDFIRNSRNKYAYILPKGRRRAEEILKTLGIEDKELYERFEFREIHEEEADDTAVIEAACFPPKEACSLEHMRERVAAAKEIFLVAVDRKTEKIAGFVNGIATDEIDFKMFSLQMPRCISLTGRI